MPVTRIRNNQVTDSSAGNTIVGINAGTKIQDYSITAGKIANNLTYGSDLTVTGNLTVQGNTTAIDTTITTIEDPVIVLASTQTGAPAVDIGFIGERGTSNNIAFVWDESSTEFVTAFTSTAETNTTIAISSYANFHTNDANIGGNIVINGTTSLVGNLVGAVQATGNITAGNIGTAGQVVATGNVSGGNLLTGGSISATGNVTAANFFGNIAGNIDAAGANTQVQFNDTGDILGASAGFTFDKTANLLTVSGTVQGGNLSTGGTVSATGNVNGTGAVFSGNVTAQNFFGNIAGNIDAGGANTNIQFNDNDILAGSAAFTFDKTSNAVTASGNITAGNLLTGGLVSATSNVTGGNLLTGGLVSATSNITGGNLLTGGLISATGNASVGNLLTGGLVSATGSITAAGNIAGNNVSVTNDLSTGTLSTVGNALIGGNLVVNGNISYINIDDLRVEDPVIILGTGPNGAPLTVDDGLDRGVFMEYYKSGLGNAFMGWDNSSGNMFIASNVSFAANDIVAVNQYGTLEAGNLYIQSAFATGNISAGNLISAGSLQASSISATGNIDGGNINTVGLISATGNITGGNIDTAGQVVATGNITGGNLTTGAQVVATGNVSGGNLTTGAQVVATGNITGGNLNTAGRVVATGNIVSSGNISAGNLIAGANVIITNGVYYANGAPYSSGSGGGGADDAIVFSLALG
jgi:hypothetical protein